MRAEEVVRQFVDSINHADVNRLAALMTEDHVFVDSDGSEVVGRASALEGWAMFFSMVRDYRVDVGETFHSKNIVIVVGTATGACVSNGPPPREKRWFVPAAWRAVVKAGRISVWQVFVNPEPILAAMRGPENGPV